jgi:hypothetical protein
MPRIVDGDLDHWHNYSAVRNPIEALRRLSKAADEKRCRKAFALYRGIAYDPNFPSRIEDEDGWYVWKAGWQEHQRQTLVTGWLRRNLSELGCLVVAVVVIALFVSGRCDLAVQH